MQWAYRRMCNASLEWCYDCSKMPVKSLHGHSCPKNCTFVEPSPDSPCGPSYCRPSANCYHANIFSILFYRDDIIEKDPAKTWGPQFYDARAGTAIWRSGFTQRFDDEIVVATSARSADGGWGKTPRSKQAGTTRQPDLDDVRITGLGGYWATGPTSFSSGPFYLGNWSAQIITR